MRWQRVRHNKEWAKSSSDNNKPGSSRLREKYPGTNGTQDFLISQAGETLLSVLNLPF